MSDSALKQLAALAPHASTDAPLWVALAGALQAQAEVAELSRLVVANTEQAVRVANVDSVSALRRWARKWRVRPVGHDRWSVQAIHCGLEREACNVLHKHKARSAPRARPTPAPFPSLP